MDKNILFITAHVGYLDWTSLVGRQDAKLQKHCFRLRQLACHLSKESLAVELPGGIADIQRYHLTLVPLFSQIEPANDAKAEAELLKQCQLATCSPY
ncbi:hypothetical protein SLE2022_281510 [Rubroshorea leprosula]